MSDEEFEKLLKSVDAYEEGRVTARDMRRRVGDYEYGCDPRPFDAVEEEADALEKATTATLRESLDEYLRGLITEIIWEKSLEEAAAGR